MPHYFYTLSYGNHYLGIIPGAYLDLVTYYMYMHRHEIQHIQGNQNNMKWANITLTWREADQRFRVWDSVEDAICCLPSNYDIHCLTTSQATKQNGWTSIHQNTMVTRVIHGLCLITPNSSTKIRVGILTDGCLTVIL